MSKPAFTPGPWEPSLVDETSVFTVGGEYVASTYQDDADYRDNYKRREADARLIAAAPDMLKALRWTVTMLEGINRAGWVTSAGYLEEIGFALDAARKAIAKAEARP
jgi:hypothetical protein